MELVHDIVGSAALLSLSIADGHRRTQSFYLFCCFSAASVAIAVAVAVVVVIVVVVLTRGGAAAMDR